MSRFPFPPGNTGNPSTVSDQVDKLKVNFGLAWTIMVGDRGMLTQTQIEALNAHSGIDWISALRSEKIHQIVEEHSSQLSLFDEQNAAEIHPTDFSDECLIDLEAGYRCAGEPFRQCPTAPCKPGRIHTGRVHTGAQRNIIRRGTALGQCIRECKGPAPNA